MLNDVTLVTPCYEPDVERLAFLRESMAACHVDLPHAVIVPDADREQFERFENEPGLTVWSSSAFSRLSWSAVSIGVSAPA